MSGKETTPLPFKAASALSSPGFWEKAWKRVYERSPLRTCVEPQREAWFAFWNEVSDIYLNVVNYSLAMGKTVAEFFFSEGIAQEGSYILDVGAGPGTLALPFAERGAAVMALDPAPKMLHRLMAEARRQGLNNIFPLCQAFEHCHFRQKFDVVVASFSPAICDGPSLRRLEEFSRRYCALIVPADLKRFSWRDSLWERVMQEPLHTFRYPPLLPFNLLYTLERRPNIKQLSFYVKAPSPKLASKFYARYFSLFGKDEADTERVIASIINKNGNGKKVGENTSRHVAVIWWEL